jgi:teichuronic acid biosynthesis glycosyltransferase TuaG
MKPLVSIITSAYNHGRYISECIESVLKQTYPNIEHIVINDGSTDNTPEAVSRYLGRIDYICRANKGETVSVNEGLSMARGDIVVVLSADDILYPHAIETGVDFLNAHPDVYVAYPDYDYIDGNSWYISTRHAPEYDYRFMVRRHYCTPGLCTFITRKLLNNLPQRDTRYKYAADFAYWLVAGLSVKFAHIPICLGGLRIHNGSASVSKGNLIAGEHISLMENYFNDGEFVLPLRILKLKREAIAWAHLIAGIVARRSMVAVLKYGIGALVRHPIIPLELADLKKFK